MPCCSSYPSTTRRYLCSTGYLWHESFKKGDINGQFGLGPMLVTSLPVLFLALAIHPSACSSVAAPSAAEHLVPRTTLIDGRLLYRHSLLPVDVGLYNEDERNWSKRTMLEAALGSFLIKPLVGIVTDYSEECSRQFAEELYAELAEGKTGLWYKELYDAEGNVLKERHYFWDYLSGRMQRVVVLTYMLWQANSGYEHLRKALDSFATLVGKKVPQAEYFVRRYFDGRARFLLHNMSMDEWPQIWMNEHGGGRAGKQSGSRARESASYGLVAAIHCALMQDNLKWLKHFAKHRDLESSEWLKCFQLLHAVEPFLLRKFFDIDFAEDEASDGTLFAVTALAAVQIDPVLSNRLIAIAKRNRWARPVAKQIELGAELADNAEAGGSVHMQPLQPVAQNLDCTGCGLYFAGSSTLKTVANNYGVQLHIAAGNVLCALSKQHGYALFIRSFESGKVSTHPLVADHQIKVNVQHGDVTAVSYRDACVFFLKEEAYCTSLSARERFERVKSFCYSARDTWACFLAIVQSDGVDDGTRDSRKRKDGGKKTKMELGKQQPSRRQKLEHKGAGNGGQDELQES